MQLTIAYNINKEKIACVALGLVCLLLAALYMYLVSASVVHVVIHKETTQQMVVVNSEISELENQYIAAQHRVSNHVASLEGYAEIRDKVFIDRTPSSLVLVRADQ